MKHMQVNDRVVAVIGPDEKASDAELAQAFAVGEALAKLHITLVTGGLGGVMDAAAAGVRHASGVSIGLLPGFERSEGSGEHTVLLPTGLGQLRNGLVVNAADVVLAIGCSWGTLSEIALTARARKPLVILGGWDVPQEYGSRVTSAEEAVREVLTHLDDVND